MSAPTQNISWATNTDYAAGSEVGEPNTSEPLSGRKADGFSPETPPAAQELNWWMAGVAAWIAYLNGLVNALLAAGWRWQLPGVSILTAGSGSLSQSGTDFSVGGTGPAVSRFVTRVDAPPVGSVISAAAIVQTMHNDTSAQSHGQWDLIVIDQTGTQTTIASTGNVVGPFASRTVESLAMSGGGVGGAYTMNQGDTLMLQTTVGTASGGSVILYELGLVVAP